LTKKKKEKKKKVYHFVRNPSEIDKAHTTEHAA